MISQLLAQTEPAIFQKIHGKGWNAYRSTDSGKRGAESVIREGPVTTLIVNERYALLPLIQDSSNPEAVMSALEKFAVRVDRKNPVITLDELESPWTGFIPRALYVQVNTDCGHDVSYKDFVLSLNSITPCKLD